MGLLLSGEEERRVARPGRRGLGPRTSGPRRCCATRCSTRIGETPLVELQRIPGGPRPACLREARERQPRRQRQGPRRQRDRHGGAIRAGCPARAAAARRDQREHRHRLRDARRGARLRRDALRARLGEPRAPADPARLRRRGRRDGPARGLGRSDPAGARAVRAEQPGRLLLRRPVLEPGEPSRARANDRPRDPEPARGPAARPLRGRSRNERDVRRHLALPAACEPDDAPRLRRARRSVPRARGPEAHGDGARSRDLRPGAGRRRARREHRGGLRDDAAPGARGGPLRRALERRGRRGRAPRLGRERAARTVAIVLPDGGDRYLSDRFWEEA